MTTGCGILLLVDEDVIVEAENTETKRSNGFGRIVKSPYRQNVSKAGQNYQTVSPLFRLRVIPHFSLGIVERAKRERA